MDANVSIIKPMKNYTSFKRQVMDDKRLIFYLMILLLLIFRSPINQEYSSGAKAFKFTNRLNFTLIKESHKIEVARISPIFCFVGID